jgi:TusA-related sulfurtransferase
MPKPLKLDLVGIGWPVCLLEFKRVLNGISRGDILEITMQDPDAVDELVTIVERSSDRVLKVNEKAERYSIRIQKG